MTKKILFIAPLVDVATISSNIGIKQLYFHALDKEDIDPDILWGISASKPSFHLRNRLEKYNGIVYWGHGESHKLTGNFYSLLDKKNIREVRGKGIDTMACNTLEILGPLAIKNGATAYIGTRGKYFAAFPEKERNFLRDWLDYTTSKTKALIDGKTFGEAHRIFQQKAKQYLNIYNSNISNKGNFDWYYRTTLHNLKNTLLIGDPNARLF